jgi:amino acid transporter
MEDRAPLIVDDSDTSANGASRSDSGSTLLSDRGGHNKTLTVPLLASLFFFSVAGGPVGSEGLVSLLGPCVGLISIVLFPLVYSFPVALVTAELSTAFTKAGGYIHWVDAAFGRRAAFLCGYTSYLSGVVDSAIYPVLFCNYFVSSFGDPGIVFQWLLKIGFIVVWSFVVFLGPQLVGRTTIIVGVAILLPFVVFVIMGLPQVEPSRWWNGPPKDTTFADFCAFISLLYWNYSGADQVSTFASEVKTPKTTYPRAIIIGVCLVAAQYMLPLLTASGLEAVGKSNFTDGSFPQVAKMVGGDGLSFFILASSWLGCCALFIAEVFEDAYLLLGMAEENFVPEIFAYRHPTRDTPVVSLLFGVVLLLCASSFSFLQIVAVDNVLNCFSVIMELFAAVRLRWTQPDLPRPYRVPMNRGALLASMCMPITLSVAVMALSLGSDPTGAATWIIVGVVAVGIVCNEIRAQCFSTNIRDLAVCKT